jgi:chemotaxis methyl-accepting protein methylase
MVGYENNIEEISENLYENLFKRLSGGKWNILRKLNVNMVFSSFNYLKNLDLN